MMQLLRKDLPWLVVFAVGGAIALAITVASVGFVDVFVLGPERLEGLFWTAGSLGMALGVWSVTWDDLLGTREFLEQRGVSRRRLAAAPIVACLCVLTAWAVLVPVLGWILASIDEGVFAPTFWAGVPEIQATLAIALPAAACGMFANALPAGRLLRLLLLGGLVAVVGCGLDLLDGTLSDGNRVGLLLLADAAFAAPLFALAFAAHRRRYDPDRAWDPATRRLHGTVALTVLAITAAGAVALFELDRIGALQLAYPELVLHEGRVQLARRGDSYQWWQPCNDEHVAVGATWSVSEVRSLSRGGRRSWQKIEIEAPRFRTRASREWLGHLRQLLLRDDGSAWIRDYTAAGFVAGAFVPTGISVERSPLPAGSRLKRLDVVGAGPGVQQVFAFDPAGGGLWRFDEQAGHFTPLPLPGGDRMVSFDQIRRRDGTERVVPAALQSFGVAHDAHIEYAHAGTGDYVLTSAGWILIEVPRVPAEQRPELEVIGNDLLCYSIALPATAERSAARHDFSPRTGEEHVLAALACGASLLRAPIQQVWSFVFAPADNGMRAWGDRLSPWNDPLLAGGRRWWLLLLCLGIGAGSAWQMRRFLRKWGADASTIRFWTVAAALTGIVGVVVGELCERPRAHARRPVTEPAAPRIVTT